MTADQIWGRANENRVLVQDIYRGIIAGRDITFMMDRLKRLMPPLHGVDVEEQTLLFISSDAGYVGLIMREEGDDFILALASNIEIEGYD